jgi:5-methylcytosine-specific restriction endonuclease McrA
MLAQRKVLVLNKSWTPIKIITLEKALKKLAGVYRDGTPKARIIDCVHDFRDMTWEDWAYFCPVCQEVRKKRDEIGEGHTCIHCRSKLGQVAKDCEDGIRTINTIFRVPTVIQEGRFDKLPTQKVHYNRRAIYRRDNDTCQYCGKKKPTSELSLDHVLPRCQGGLTTWENIVVACTECNAKKAGRTPKEASMKLLRQPKKPRYNFFPGDIRVKDWEQFLGQAYWLTELEHDGD